jgi:hypothetical protein
VGYGGPGAVETAENLLVLVASKENAKRPKMDGAAKISLGRRSVLVRIAYHCFMARYAAPLLQYGRQRVGSEHLPSI